MIDEQFVVSAKTLIQEADKRKQWLGFMLITRVFDPQVSKIDEAVFTRHINIILHSMSNSMNKHELFDEVSVVACRAWRSVF